MLYEVITEDNHQLVRDLSGMTWTMKMMLPGEGVKNGLDVITSYSIHYTKLYESLRGTRAAYKK